MGGFRARFGWSGSGRSAGWRVFAAVLLAAALAASAGLTSQATATASAASPATWKPWLLTSADQFRLAAPPAAASAQTKGELKELLRLQKHRSPAAVANIAKWLRQPTVVPWMQLELQMFQNYRPRVAPASRYLGLLGAGMYDAMIAAYDSHDAYAKTTRPEPWKLDKRLKPAMKFPAGSTYAPYDAAVAGAAEKILTYLFPGEPPRTFTRAANDAVNARLQAGLNYRSDVEQARALGRKVAALAIARGESDGHTNTGYSEGPFVGEQYWVLTPPEYEGAIGADRRNMEALASARREGAVERDSASLVVRLSGVHGPAQRGAPDELPPHRYATTDRELLGRRPRDVHPTGALGGDRASADQVVQAQRPDGAESGCLSGHRRP